MPTAVPDPQLLQAVQKTVDNAFNQGIVGVLLLLGAMGVFTSIALVVYFWRRPVKKDDEPVSVTLSKVLDKTFTKLEKLEAERKAEQQQQHEAAQKMSERFIAAMESNALANTKIAGGFDTQSTDIGVLKKVINQMATDGSIPLQELIKTVNRIEEKLDESWKAEDEDRKLKANVLQELSLVNAALKRIEDQRKTSEMKKIVLPEALPPTVAPEAN